jgi:CheY-like chemotaxis protein
MKKLILVVDDDNDDVFLFREAVKKINKDYHCLTASNGEEALEVLETASIIPDIIFMDINMPRMNGKECLKHLKNNPQFSAIPITIYSTSNREHEIEEIYKLGAVDFFTKPIRFNNLVETIANILATKTLAA